jgi:DNA-binding NarL/FixJ family response regulator
VGLRVLIVDDEPLVASALARQLRAYGCVVTSEQRPRSVLTTLSSLTEAARELQGPEAVVSDLHMPGMRGTDFLLEIKRLVPLARRVLISAVSEHVTAAEMLALSPCALMPKPWTTEALLNALGLDESPN